MAEEKAKTPQKRTSKKSQTKEAQQTTVQSSNSQNTWQQAKAKQAQSSNNQNSWQQKQQVKKGSKISIKTFVIGCIGFFMFFVLLVIWGLYLAVNSPDMLSAMWLEVEDVRSLLMIFAIVFFGILFITIFYLLVLNVYRMLTVSVSKIKYIIWGFFTLILMIWVIVSAGVTIYQISEMAGEREIVTDDIINPYMIMEENDPVLVDGTNPPLIAPLYVRFELNQVLFQENIMPDIWDNIQWFTLDCDNGQTLTAGREIIMENSFFDWVCFFPEEDNYQITLEVEYMDPSTGDLQTLSPDIDPLNFVSEVTVETNWEVPQVLDNEVLFAWEVPVNMTFDARDVFLDLDMDGREIQRDLTWNFEVDEDDSSRVSWSYENTGAQHIHYKIPEISDDFYMIRFQSNEPEVPPCDISYTEDEWLRYDFNISVHRSVSAQNFEYQLMDMQDQDMYDMEQTSSSTYSTRLEEWREYQLQVTYETPDGQEWHCQTEIQAWVEWYTLDFDTFIRKGGADEYESLEFDYGDWMEVDVIPSRLKIVADDITPQPRRDYEKSINIWDEQLQEISNGEYIYDIDEEWEFELSVTIEDDVGNSNTETYDLIVERPPLEADLSVSPDSGNAPLEVSLDASASQAREEDDEIVYFDYDFDDGETMTNVSQWIVSHTYDFDEHDPRYEPTVTVETREWYTDQATAEVLVQREEMDVDIRIPSHPTQAARVGDNVEFNLDSDWRIEEVEWDFDNWNTISWEWRQYTNINTTYEEPWDYRVSARVYFDDAPPITERVTIRVE